MTAPLGDSDWRKVKLGTDPSTWSLTTKLQVSGLADAERNSTQSPEIDPATSQLYPKGKRNSAENRVF